MAEKLFSILNVPKQNTKTKRKKNVRAMRPGKILMLHKWHVISSLPVPGQMRITKKKEKHPFCLSIQSRFKSDFFRHYFLCCWWWCSCSNFYNISFFPFSTIGRDPPHLLSAWLLFHFAINRHSLIHVHYTPFNFYN